MTKTTNNSSISISALTVVLRDTPVLWNAHGTITRGTMTAIVGSNGAGKSTLMKTMVGLVPPLAGSIHVEGVPFHTLDFAYVPQRSTIDWDFPLHVIDVVIMGCYKRLGWLKRPTTTDYAQAHAMLAHVGMSNHAHTPIGQLSGGQQQRIWMARALMQNPSYYLLDEPFNAIDAATQDLLLQLLTQLTQQGKTVIVIHHDPLIVQTHFDWVVTVKDAGLICQPTTKTVQLSLDAPHGMQHSQHQG